MWILMAMRQIKWDHVVIGNYKMRNCSIIAYLQSFLMNVGRKINFTQNKCYLYTHKTTHRINTPMFKQNIFLYTRTKWRPIALIYLIYWTDSSGVLIYRVPSVKIQYSKRVLQQTKCKLNCMQNHMITRHIYITFILNRIYINNIQLSFWRTKLCIQSKTKETSKSVTIKAGRKKCDIYQWCAVLFSFFFPSVECFCRNIPFVWVNLLCQQTRRSPNVMGICWHLKAITIREVL